VIAPVSAGAHSTELTPKSAYAPQPRPAEPVGLANHPLRAAQPHERPLTHSPGPPSGRPAEQPPPPGHRGGGNGEAAGKAPHDPIYSREQSGAGWDRLQDEPRHPHYGEPLPDHWQYSENPVDPRRIHPDVAKLITDPDAPYGRDPQGDAYTQQEYEERFNKLGPDGQHWYNFASGDGALEGTKVAFNDLEQYSRFYGQQIDRIGDDTGTYLAVMEDGKPAFWEDRSLHVDSLSKALHAYTIDHLPDGWRIEVSKIEPAVGQPGGAIQVRIVDDANVVVSVEELRRTGVLR
jgi:hypothetical protein